ncbi:putative porin [Methyloradius palustris]|uniref:Porin n=1 Tax=Methyloradius palustris TaxID=2778876 RepID=A0A8D5JMA7_9PROT|nr:putative porin [Methyloradius palustris]BCM25675.1 hypothetical protein ZMTM_19340 [Methyloradius palustris]
MKSMKLRGVFIAVTGALALSFSAGAMADSTFDLVDALVKKGVLTEEEALPLLKGRENDIAAADKKVKKAARVTISDAIDNATVYGDVRVREEYRKGGGFGTAGAGAGIFGEEERSRGRYKLTFGVETKADDFYTDLAFAMGPGGRSDNATFGNGGNGTNGANNKETLYVKRAMVGWKMTDWLAVEAGRIKNPLYTTSMVWDGDLTFEGAAEKVSYDYNKINFFGNFVQSQYVGDYKNFSNVGNPSLSTSGDRYTNNILAFQGGLKFPITDMVSAKAAITYTTYSNNKNNGNNSNQNIFVPSLTGASTGIVAANSGTNNLQTIEIPAEIEFKTAGDLSYKVFGDYVYNTAGSDRFNAAINSVGANTTTGKKLAAAGNDDTAWLLGAGITSAKDKKPSKGDWQAKFWWQDVGTYAVDQNAVDSDLMDSRVNMKGVVAKATYNLRSNVFVDVTGASATRKNSALATSGTASDIGLDLNKYQLLQLDLTYKF